MSPTGAVTRGASDRSGRLRGAGCSPLPWSDFYIARGRLPARAQQQDVEDEHRQQAKQLLETARTIGLHFGTPELAVLASR